MPTPVEIVAQELARRQAGGATPQGLMREQQFQLRGQENARQQMELLLRLQNAQRLQQTSEEESRYRRGQEQRQGRLDELRVLTELRKAGEGSFSPIYGPEGNVTELLDTRTGRRKALEAPIEGRVGTPPPALPSGERKRLEELGGSLSELVGLAKSFKPEFTNAFGPQVGALENVVRQYAPIPGIDRDMPNWWRLYERVSKIPARHAEFGAALTPRESASWEKAEVNPGMDPKDIIKNVNIRAALAHIATGRSLKSASARFNKREVESAAGIPVGSEDLLKFPSLEELERMGSRLTGQGRPPLEKLLGP